MISNGNIENTANGAKTELPQEILFDIYFCSLSGVRVWLLFFQWIFDWSKCSKSHKYRIHNIEDGKSQDTPHPKNAAHNEVVPRMPEQRRIFSCQENKRHPARLCQRMSTVR